MCGRYTLRTRLNELLQIYAVETELQWAPRFNIAPAQTVPTIRNSPQGEKRELAMLRWGLVPSWATDPRIGNRLINARRETLSSKPAFRQALGSRRCLVPADGFYEWKKSGKTKQPYFLEMAGGRPFVFAGLWERWTKSPPAVESFTIITTPPNALLADIHDRMPAILTEDAARLWLDQSVDDVKTLTSLLAPYPADQMAARAVGRLVNSASHDSVDCVKPLEALL
jgi:putative SOS response-associated peptidase YedK